MRTRRVELLALGSARAPALPKTFLLCRCAMTVAALKHVSGDVTSFQDDLCAMLVVSFSQSKPSNTTSYLH